MIHRRRYGPAIAAATAAALLAACQSGGAAPLSLSGLTKTVDGMAPDGTDKCPLSYDMAKAVKTAGVDTAAGPGSVNGADGPAATGEGGKRAKPEEPLAENPGALVSCTFHIGPEDVEVHTIATRKPQASASLAPVVQRQAGMSTDDLIAYMNKAGEAEAGEPVLTGSGNVATVRLKLDGEGDAALLIGIGETGRSSLEPARVGALAEALASQVQ
ncbi:hypothetical protein [Streptomyces sp. NRRL S-237]|uniref:hypothetical protein n=1 Tax=Streptomyces sp. NRRL S-237 TaxID=1463895 RepID=UPI00068D6215|nr:hypothetical protein [Streptomyces sp. NRRL S-237]